MGRSRASPFVYQFCLVEKEYVCMKQKRAYLYRCYPTPGQRHTLARTFGSARFVFNWALRLRSDAYRQRREHVFYSDTSAALTRLKRQAAYGWLNEVSCVPPQQTLRHLDKAFRNFFEGRGRYPTFKKKHGRQSAEYTRLCLHVGWHVSDAGKDGCALANSLESPVAHGCKADHDHREQGCSRALLCFVPGGRGHSALAGLAQDGRD